MMWRVISILTVLQCFPLLGGCSLSSKPCFVSGQATVNNKLEDGVYLVFHHERSKEAVSTARTDHSGKYVSRIPLPGTYAVTAFWPRVVKSVEETIEGEDRFGGRFRDPASPLATVTIERGDNYPAAINISLK